MKTSWTRFQKALSLNNTILTPQNFTKEQLKLDVIQLESFK
jgi:hypothetical protein